MHQKRLLISTRLHQNNFDVIRFLLASLVIFCHSYVILYGYEKFSITEPLMVFSKQQMSLGTFAVNMFFIISLPIAIIMAFASWHCVEAPFLKLKALRQKPVLQ